MATLLRAYCSTFGHEGRPSLRQFSFMLLGLVLNVKHNTLCTFVFMYLLRQELRKPDVAWRLLSTRPLYLALQ